VNCSKELSKPKRRQDSADCQRTRAPYGEVQQGHGGDPAFEKLVARDAKDGRKPDIGGVPTLFINGKVLKNRSMQGIQEMIAAELKKAGRDPLSRRIILHLHARTGCS